MRRSHQFPFGPLFPGSFFTSAILSRNSFSLNGVMINVAFPIRSTAEPWVISYRLIASNIGAAELSGEFRSCSHMARVLFWFFRAYTIISCAVVGIEETSVSSSFKGAATHCQSERHCLTWSYSSGAAPTTIAIEPSVITSILQSRPLRWDSYTPILPVSQ